MAEQGVGRRLAAILCADVVGYSRLMGADEVGTLARLNRHRDELIDPAIAHHRGRIVKTTGDGLLLEFASVVDAVQCAVQIQRAMAERNAGVAEDQRIEFRIGVNLGDIIVEGDDIFSDGVNVAARLEGLADPGGICIQRSVRDQIRDRLPLILEDMGEQQVKNIARAVRVFRVVLDEAEVEKSVERAPARTTPAKPWRRIALAGGLAVVLAAAGVTVWLQPWQAADGPALALPDKPSIAVLPFTNMSGDADQEYFADGISEDLITDLSKISGLFVIARNSSFVYKGKSVDVKQVGRALGVKYVLEGSVRRAGGRVRVTAQLIDATTGGHLWAERYDGSLADVFALQDEVTRKIIAELAVRLTPREQAGQSRKETASVPAHDAFLRGWAHYLKATPADYAKAVPFLKQAVRHDPAYGRAYAALAAVYRTARFRGWQGSLGMTPDDALEKAMEYLEKAARYPTPLAHRVASRMMTGQGAHDEAIEEARRAISLNANDPAGHFAMARALTYQPVDEVCTGRRRPGLIL
jgi:TolB-like protein/class 3 adenylate cyclase